MGRLLQLTTTWKYLAGRFQQETAHNGVVPNPKNVCQNLLNVNFLTPDGGFRWLESRRGSVALLQPPATRLRAKKCTNRQLSHLKARKTAAIQASAALNCWQTINTTLKTTTIRSTTSNRSIFPCYRAFPSLKRPLQGTRQSSTCTALSIRHATMTLTTFYDDFYCCFDD